MEKNTKLANDFGVEDHIVICNWTKKSDLLVKELHNPSVEKQINECTSNEYFPSSILIC